MLELVRTIFGFLVNVLPLTALEGVVIIAAVIYVLYLFSRQKILEERIALYENRIEQLNNEVKYLTSLRTQTGITASKENERTETAALTASLDGPTGTGSLPPSLGVDADSLPPSIDASLTALKQEIQRISSRCLKYKVVDEPKEWESLLQEPWLLRLWRASCLSETKTFFDLIELYRRLPRGRGQGYQIEAWVRINHLEKQANLAIEELDRIKLRAQLG